MYDAEDIIAAHRAASRATDPRDAALAARIAVRDPHQGDTLTLAEMARVVAYAPRYGVAS